MTTGRRQGQRSCRAGEEHLVGGRRFGGAGWLWARMTAAALAGQGGLMTTSRVNAGWVRVPAKSSWAASRRFWASSRGARKTLGRTASLSRSHRRTCGRGQGVADRPFPAPGAAGQFEAGFQLPPLGDADAGVAGEFWATGASAGGQAGRRNVEKVAGEIDGAFAADSDLQVDGQSSASERPGAVFAAAVRAGVRPRASR